MRMPRRRQPPPESPFVTQVELCRRLNDEATSMCADTAMLAGRQVDFLAWLEHQVTVLQVVQVDVATLESIIRSWQVIRAGAGWLNADVADVIAVDY